MCISTLNYKQPHNPCVFQRKVTIRIEPCCYLNVVFRGKILHTRNEHLGNHRGFPVACANGCSEVFPNISSLCSGVIKRIVASPVDFTGNVRWIFSGMLQWKFTCVTSGAEPFAPSLEPSLIGALVLVVV